MPNWNLSELDRKGVYKQLLNIATIIIVLTFLFWDRLGLTEDESILLFQRGNALFISIICLFIFINFKKLWIAFFLFCISLNNLADELWFDNTKLQLNELLFTLIITYFTIKNYARKKPTDNR